MFLESFKSSIKNCLLFRKLYIQLCAKNKILVKKGNILKYDGNLLLNCNITINGTGNKVIITEDGANRLNHTKIFIQGDNNSITIGRNNNLNYLELWIEDNDGSIILHNAITVAGHTQLAVIEGSRIEVGNNCLFSSDVSIKTGDSHSIFDSFTKQRINISKNVFIGDRVWLGHRAVVLKGVKLNSDIIVGTGAIVSKSINKSNVVIAGIPAKIVKENVYWQNERV